MPIIFWRKRAATSLELAHESLKRIEGAHFAVQRNGQPYNRQGLEIPEEVHQRLLARFLKENPSGVDYRVFITLSLEAGQ